MRGKDAQRILKAKLGVPLKLSAVAPHMNADYMNAHLKFISDAAGSDTHVILILDGAGWHVAKGCECRPISPCIICPPTART